MKRTIFHTCFVFLFFISVSVNVYAHRTDVKKGQAAGKPGAGVPLLEELYVLEFPITSKSDKAQKYFSQGLVFTYGFDHIDAERSFLEAVRHDPQCAMCYWGAALVLGPNINAPMDDAAVPRAHEYIQQAMKLSADVTEKEKMLIQALAVRYAAGPVRDRSNLDRAYADAMRKVADAYPDDPDIGVLLAEALMDLHPWDYWKIDGQPQPWTPEIQSRLESIIERHPRHPEVHHLYIHLLENSPMPEKIVRSADVIVDLVPLSGHLVHMASHAYLAAGLYHDCSEANEKAIKVDQLLASSFPSQGLYHLLYIPHVRQFLLACYTLEGRSRDALQTAGDLSKSVEDSMAREPANGTVQHYWLFKYYALARFGMWDEILAEAPPEKSLRYPTGVWHYVRGLALARKQRFREAEEELHSLKKIADDPAMKTVTVWDLNKASDLLAIAAEVLEGELSVEQGQHEDAVVHLEKAVKLEEGLVFDEPPPWYYPVRQSLGAVLLEKGEAETAEKVFREDIRINSESGWSLYGLAKSLRAQNKNNEAADIEKRFRRIWARADIQLKSSRF